MEISEFHTIFQFKSALPAFGKLILAPHLSSEKRMPWPMGPIPSALLPPPAEYCVEPVALSLVHAQVNDLPASVLPNQDHPFVVVRLESHILFEAFSDLPGLGSGSWTPTAHNLVLDLTVLYIISFVFVSSRGFQIHTSLQSTSATEGSPSMKGSWLLFLQQTHPSWSLPW